jgi:hypothetical protein
LRRDIGADCHAIYHARQQEEIKALEKAVTQTPWLWVDALDASALASARSFNELPLFCADAPFLLFRACAAAAICLSRIVDASERVSSVTNLDFAGGIVYAGNLVLSQRSSR